MGDYGEAKSWFRKALAIEPQNKEVIKQLYRIKTLQEAAKEKVLLNSVFILNRSLPVCLTSNHAFDG